MERVELGDLVEDKITGFKGIVTCTSHWLNGCARMVVQPNKLDKEGRVLMTESFDENQLKIIKKQVIELEPIPSENPNQRTGGPRPDPTWPNLSPGR